MTSLAKCIALVPYRRTIEAATEECLRALEARGVAVRRRGGCSAIDFIRSELASAALIDGFESILFIDSDMLFRIDDALRLLGRPEPVVAGLYSQKEFNHKINARFSDDVTEIPCGEAGRDFIVHGVAAGFLRIRREALLALRETLAMPCCTAHGGRLWPYFLPIVREAGNLEWEYLGEDYAFCRRCETAGIPVIVDTTVLLGHIGSYCYTLADAQRDPPRIEPSFVIRHRSR